MTSVARVVWIDKHITINEPWLVAKLADELVVGFHVGLERSYTIPELAVLLSEEIISLLVRYIFSFAAGKVSSRGLRVNQLLLVKIRVRIIDALIMLNVTTNLKVKEL